jgi:nitrogen regulatory protein PII
MKAIFIIHNQSFTERVEYILDRLNLKGFTRFTDIKGRGSETGDPRLGTHTWPEINTATFTVVEDSMVDVVMEKIEKLDKVNKEIGIRAFVWDILQSY